MGKNSHEICAILSGEMPHFFTKSDFAEVEEGSPHLKHKVYNSL